jgi:ribosomal protein S18 acetylase RimI-like enzyme
MFFNWTDTTTKVDWIELTALYQAAKLGNKSANNLKIVYANSLYKSFLYDNGKLVGAGRALADGVDCAYLCDIALLPSHQGQGLGQAIVQRLLDFSRGHKKIILYAVPGKENFYKKLGFKRMITAMAIFADQDAALRQGYVNDN